VRGGDPARWTAGVRKLDEAFPRIDGLWIQSALRGFRA